MSLQMRILTNGMAAVCAMPLHYSDKVGTTIMDYFDEHEGSYQSRKKTKEELVSLFSHDGTVAQEHWKPGDQKLMSWMEENNIEEVHVLQPPPRETEHWNAIQTIIDELSDEDKLEGNPIAQLAAILGMLGGDDE